MVKDSKDKKILNLPSVDLPITPMRPEEIEKDIRKRVSHIAREFKNGFDFIKDHPKSVTFFGSARFDPENGYYKQAASLAESLSDSGYSILTGGGPGIMEGANLGAKRAGGKSLGLSISLPEEQVTNPYVTDFREFHYFFTRKVCLTFSAEAYVYFPGGLGTLDEFFEILTLVQTKKIRKVPIVLFGSDFWVPFQQFLHDTLYKKYKTIDKGDMDLFKICNGIGEAADHIKSEPVHYRD